MEKYPTLYKTDSKGKTRIWFVEREDDRIRNTAGLIDGQQVTSAWKQMKQKNVGRANETSTIEQAEAEIKSLYEAKLGAGGYTETLETATAEKYFKPQLAEPYRDSLPIQFRNGVYSQPKLDGMRCIATADGLFTRKGKKWVSVPHIALELFDVFERFPSLVLDGELYNHQFKADFNELSSILRKQKPEREHIEKSAQLAEYHIYDAFFPAEPNMRFANRSMWLTGLFDEFKFEMIKLVPSAHVISPEDVDTIYFDQYLGDGYEGQILRYDREYVKNGRHKHLMVKRKEFFDEEFKIKDIIEGEGNLAGHAASVVFFYDDTEDTCDAGIIGDRAFCKKLLEERELYLDSGYATVTFPNKTPAGKRRFGKAKDFHYGKRQD